MSGFARIKRELNLRRGLGTALRSIAGPFLCALVLGGCASIPLSTMLHLSNLSPESLARIDPAGVEVKISTPRDWSVDVESARLRLTVSNASGSSSMKEMHLRLLRVTHGTLGGGLFSSSTPVTTSWLALSEDGVRQLRVIQQFVELHHPNRFNFGITWQFSQCPRGARKVTLWADLRLAPDQAFMTLIDGAVLKFPKGSECDISQRSKGAPDGSSRP